MAEERIVRRLAAILAADVVGYSRMMSEDEAGTLATLQAHQSEFITIALERHQGRIVKLMGDGMLAQFSSAVEAVACAAEIQRELARRNRDASQKMEFRIGVHVGDVIVDKDDIYGDGVNIAARLEGIAETGGICISRQAFEQVDGKLALAFRQLGPQTLKNIAKRMDVFAVEASDLTSGQAHTSILSNLKAGNSVLSSARRGAAGMGQGWPGFSVGEERLLVDPSRIRLGKFTPASRPRQSLEEPYVDPLRRARQRHVRLGCGCKLSLETWISDLATVVDAAGLNCFPLLEIPQGCAVSIAFAVRHPHRVSHLILYGGFALGGKKRSLEEREKRNAMVTLMRLEWEFGPSGISPTIHLTNDPRRHEGADQFFNELQRRTTSPECAARYFETVGDRYVTDLLPRVSVPTLVMHVRDDLMNPFEAGRQMAAGIPGARFLALQGQNHMLLPGEPAAVRFREELELFLRRK